MSINNTYLFEYLIYISLKFNVLFVKWKINQIYKYLEDYNSNRVISNRINHIKYWFLI